MELEKLYILTYSVTQRIFSHSPQKLSFLNYSGMYNLYLKQSTQAQPASAQPQHASPMFFEFHFRFQQSCIKKKGYYTTPHTHKKQNPGISIHLHDARFFFFLLQYPLELRAPNGSICDGIMHKQFLKNLDRLIQCYHPQGQQSAISSFSEAFILSDGWSCPH